MYLVGDEATADESVHALMYGGLDRVCGIIVMPDCNTVVKGCNTVKPVGLLKPEKRVKRRSKKESQTHKRSLGPSRIASAPNHPRNLWSWKSRSLGKPEMEPMSPRVDFGPTVGSRVKMAQYLLPVSICVEVAKPSVS
jgi:hypothetical protein